MPASSLLVLQLNKNNLVDRGPTAIQSSWHRDVHRRAQKTQSASQNGFSLFDLLIAIAIIGILTSIATVNYQGFVRRAKQAGAKGNLMTLYTAEQLFYAEYQVYTDRLDAMGFEPEGAMNYSVGFFQDYGPPTNPQAPRGTPNCYVTCKSGGPLAGGVLGVSGCAFTVTWTCNPSAIEGGDWSALPAGRFQAFASAWLGKTGVGGVSLLDVWTINEKRNLANPDQGL